MHKNMSDNWSSRFVAVRHSISAHRAASTGWPAAALWVLSWQRGAQGSAAQHSILTRSVHGPCVGR